MADNFNIHEWNRSRLLESNLEDSDRKAKERVDIIVNQISKDFPEEFDSPLKKSELRFAIASAMVDLTLNGLLQEGEEKEYTVEYWVNTPDGYDDQYITVKASSEEEAIEKAKESPFTKRGKNFSISTYSLNENEDPIDTIAMDVPLFIRLLEYAREDAETDMDLHNLTEKAIKQTKIRGVLSMEDYNELVGENPEPMMETLRSLFEEKGYSKYLVTPENPKGETSKLDDDTFNDILKKIATKIQEEKPGLWANIRAKRERGEKPARKGSKAYKDAVKAGKEITKKEK